MGATASSWQGAGSASANWRQRSTMLALILGTQLLPVQGGGRRSLGGGLGQGSQRVDVEIAIVGMLLAKVVAGLRLGLTPGENLLQFVDELLQILARKFPAKPKYQSWYAAHGGDSLGNLAGSSKVGLEKESSPPFLFAVKSDRGTSTFQPEWASCLAHKSNRLSAPTRGESRNASIPQNFNRLSA